VTSMLGKPGLAVLGVALAIPATALAAHPRAGTFTSTRADVHVGKGGKKIVNADINCRFQSGVGATQTIDFNARIAIKRSGSFTYSGHAEYLHFTGSGYKARMTTASVKGRFVSRTRVQGKVKGGPGACGAVSFSATYNPRAH
jgi:hypothetical protein